MIKGIEAFRTISTGPFFTGQVAFVVKRPASLTRRRGPTYLQLEVDVVAWLDAFDRT